MVRMMGSGTVNREDMGFMNQKTAWRTLPFAIVVTVMVFAPARSRGQDYEPPDPVYPLPAFHERPTSGVVFSAGGVFEFHDSEQGKKSSKPLDVLIKEYDNTDPAVFGPAEEEIPGALKVLIDRCQDATRPLAKEDQKAISAFLQFMGRKKEYTVMLKAISVIHTDSKKGVRFLIKCMEVSDAKSQIVAIGMLGNTFEAAREAVPTLRAFLEHKNRDVRFTAAMALGDDIERAIDPTLQAVLVEALKEDWSGIQAGPYYHLYHTGKLDLPIALKALKCHDKEIMALGMGELRELGPEGKEAVPLLIEILKDSTLSRDAALTLGDMGATAEPAVPALIKAMKEGDLGLAMLVPDVLGSLGPVAKAAVPALIEEVKNGNYRAAKALGRIGPDAKIAVPILEAAAKDGSIHASGALWDITHQKEEVIPLLLTALRLERTADGELFQIISRMGPQAEQTFPLVIEYLKKNDNEEAIAALGQIGTAAKAAVPLLKESIKKYDKDGGDIDVVEPQDRRYHVTRTYREFQLAVAYSLWQIDHQEREIFALLRAALKTTRPDCAIEIIGKMGPPAKEFVPDLLAIRGDFDASPSGGKPVLKALEKVDPEAAAKLKIERKQKGPIGPRQVPPD
jgi:HEAT repeat protein